MTWVKIPMLAAVDVVDVVEAVTVVAKAVDDMAGPRPVRCQLRHQKLGHARTSNNTYSPSALATRARMVICSALPWKRWLHTFVQSW